MAENTLARPGEFDALEKAKPHELIFPLLERDLDAPPAIIYWCGLRRKRVLSSILDGGLTDEMRDELRQIGEAELIALEMTARQRGEQAAETTTKTYSGNVDPDAELNRQLAKLRNHLGNADYHAHEAISIIVDILKLGREGVLPHSIGDELAAAAAVIHAIALEMTPHRRALLAEESLPLASAE